MTFGTEKMVWLSDGEKNSKIRLFVLTECTNVTDRQTDAARRHRPRLHSITRQKRTRTDCYQERFGSVALTRQTRPQWTHSMCDSHYTEFILSVAVEMRFVFK